MASVERGETTQTSTREHPDDERPFELPGEEGSAERPDAGRPPKRRREQAIGGRISDPQIQRWMIRAGAAAVLGLLFAIVFEIRIGLAVAVLTVIVDVVRRSRQHSSVEAWRKPSVAERRTERQLKGMEKAGYRTLHARAVPPDEEGVSDGQIDHLVIGPTGVYAVDSEKWDKRLPVRALSHRKLFLGPFSKKERLDEARWEADQASKLISAELGYEVPVQPSLAIYGPAISWKVLMVRNVDVYSGGRARNYLRRRPKILTAVDVERIYNAAERVLPPKYPDPDPS
jgi:Nuclease-related domain